VWRRIAVRSDQTLDRLHAGIFDAFDRFDEHLYSFYILPPGSKASRNLHNAIEYTSPIMIEEPDPFGWHETRDASRTTLGSLGLGPGAKLRYLFDFGDAWWHDITVEQTDGTPGRGRYPRVVLKIGDSPPQYSDSQDD
jgi:hypothetical protein